jgi:hypothetical protein
MLLLQTMNHYFRLCTSTATNRLRPLCLRPLMSCDSMRPTQHALLRKLSSGRANPSSLQRRFHTTQSVFNKYDTLLCSATDVYIKNEEHITDDLLQHSSDGKDEIKAIPKVESHHVMITDDLINIARHNSFAVQRNRRKKSPTSDFIAKYKGAQLVDHEEQMDDEDDDNGEGGHYNELEHGDPSSHLSPPPLITYEGKETYFQFDYRNHKTEVKTAMKNLLEKIETTLLNAHLEPYDKFRGVGTIKQNIALMEEGVKFRLGRRRSLKKDGTVIPIRKRPQNITGYIQLKRALLRLLKDRHAIYSSGNTNTITELKWKKIGQGFFGPDSDICVKYVEAERMLCDLWFRGKSDVFDKKQKWHFRLVEKKKQRLLHPRDPNEPIKPKAVKQKRYLPRQPQKDRFHWDDKRMAAIERDVLYVHILSN